MAYGSSLYIHDLDRKAFAAMNAFPQFVKLHEAYLANVDEKAAKIDLLSSAVRISDRQYANIYALLPPICEKLAIDIPDLYCVKQEHMNAFTGGNTSPYICVTSKLVKELPLEMVSSVLAHECGHIACKHYLYHSMATQLIDGIKVSPLSRIPAIRKYLTPALVTALLFWDRCSELSADRAAVLCDGGAEKTVDLLLRLHGYKNIDRNEFLRQAADLKALVSESNSTRLIELMLIKDETHPRLATRAYECYEWSKSQQFSEILKGTYTPEAAKAAQGAKTEQEVLSVDLSVSAGTAEQQASLDEITAALEKVNAELDRYTSRADAADYALAVSSGTFAGLIDSVFTGTLTLGSASQWGTDKVNSFVLKVAQIHGYRGNSIAGAVKHLEDAFPIAADTVTKDFGSGLQHHLRDFSHHPTPVGMLFSILTQFTEKVYGTDVNGVFQSVPLTSVGLELVGKNFPEKIMFGTINWVFHMVSDIAGSSGSIASNSLGTGLPGPIVSMLKELSALPLFQSTDKHGHKEVSVYISKLFNGTLLGSHGVNGETIRIKFDLRTEIGLMEQAGKQAVPVLLNECIVRGLYCIRQLITELSKNDIHCPGDLEKVNWYNILPYRNRTVDQMLAISAITFHVADTADAAIHAAILSGANWVLFSAHFVTRFNYIGAGRATIAVIKEVSNEAKETQLIHEKMILSNTKAMLFLNQLQEFKAQLGEKVSSFLVEHITTFLAGFEEIEGGLASGDSNLVIHGNVTIQQALGREPQFTSQQEFDDLLESDIPLNL